MLLAGIQIESEVSVGDGRYDARYKAQDGTLFIFELKYCPLVIPEGEKATIDDLSKMNKKAQEAMKQIEDTNYTKPYIGLGYDVYKVALVVGGRTEVLIKFQKETFDSDSPGLSQ
jgi:hypothetical protein